MKPLFKLFYNFDLSGLENYYTYSADNGEWVLFNLEKENVLVLLLPNFNWKITKEASFLNYFINKAKNTIDEGMTSGLFSFDKFPMKSLALKSCRP